MDQDQFTEFVERGRRAQQAINDLGAGPPGDGPSSITAGVLPDAVMRKIVDLAKGADPDTLVVSILAGTPETGLAHSLWSCLSDDTAESERLAIEMLGYVVAAPVIVHEVHGDLHE